MKTFHRFIFLLALVPSSALFACEVCGLQQPKLLRGITHGLGPQGPGDYVMPILMVVLMIYATYRAARCFSWSADRRHDYIKQAILDHDCHEQ